MIREALSSFRECLPAFATIVIALALTLWLFGEPIGRALGLDKIGGAALTNSGGE
jgi:hypothetical protein